MAQSWHLHLLALLAAAAHSFLLASPWAPQSTAEIRSFFLWGGRFTERTWNDSKAPSQPTSMVLSHHDAEASCSVLLGVIFMLGGCLRGQGVLGLDKGHRQP